MEKVSLWWKKRSPRDRRAIMVLSIVVPAILFWYFVTVPLQDRLKMAQRVLETRREEATEVQKLLHEYSALHGQIEGVEFKASSAVVPELEQVFKSLSASETKPSLNRTNVTIFGKSQPAAHLRLEGFQPQILWRTMNLLASSGVYIAELELSAQDNKNEFSGSIKAWLPSKD